MGLALGWTPSPKHIVRYNQIKAKEAEIKRQQMMANQEIIIEHGDLGNLDKFSERDLRKWIDDNNLKNDARALKSKQDYMEFVNKNHTFVSPVPRKRNKRLCPKTHQFHGCL